MSKYLELFKGAFDDSIGTKTKPENKPYIGYSLTEGKIAYTVVPKPVTGPADNEIWYTTVGGTKYEEDLSRANVNVVSNVYENGKGIITFDGPLTKISDHDGSPWGSFMEFDGKTLIFPDSLEYLGSSSINNCYNLEYISLPSGLKHMSSGAISFSQCNYIIYRGTKDQWNQIEKADDWYNPLGYFDGKIVHCTDGNITISAN